jgi:hypothetical protein
VTTVRASQGFCSDVLGVQDASSALSLGLQAFALDRSEFLLLAALVSPVRPPLDLP